MIGLIVQNNTDGISPDGAFDTPFTAAKVLKAVKGTGFITAASARFGFLHPNQKHQLAPGTNHRARALSGSSTGPSESLVIRPGSGAVLGSMETLRPGFCGRIHLNAPQEAI